MASIQVGTHELTKNTRQTVHKGTRTATAVVTFHPVGGPVLRDATTRAAQTGRTRAIEAYEARWGAVPWDNVEFHSIHMTSSVLVELRVPEWDA